MTKELTTILFFSALSACQTIKAQTSGDTSFDFLNLPSSSHASALGGKNVSIIEDDATMAIENPALLQSVSNKTVSIGYMNYMKGVNDFSAGYVYALKDKATIAGFAQVMNYGKLKQTDSENNIIGDFSPSDMALGALLSYYLGSDFVGGISAKFLYSQMGAYKSTAMAVDLGVNYYNEEKNFSASLVAKNLGGQLSSYYDDYEKLPFDLIAGVTKRFINTPIRVSLTVDDLTRWDYSFWNHLILGADIILSKQFYASAGYNFRRGNDMKVSVYENDEKYKGSHGAGWSFGAGLQLSRFKIHASYAIYHIASSNLMLNVGFTL